MSQLLPITMAINRITDHMIENKIHAAQIRGFKSLDDLGSMGTEFHVFVYGNLKPLHPHDQTDALKILGGLNI